VLWNAPGTRSSIARASAWALSVVTSTGWPWSPIAVAKNRVAASVSRLLETYASRTCPCWSTARYT